MARILAVGAHPDDVEVGCGGTLLLHRQIGDALTLVVVSDGAMGGDSHIRQAEQENAAQKLGADLIMLGRPDCNVGGGLPTQLSVLVDKISPDIVYSHGAADVHQDHISTHMAIMSATRGIESVLLFESPRSPAQSRGAFVDISTVIEDKIALVACHGSQLIRSPLLSEKLLRARCALHGGLVGAHFAERFDVIRLVRSLG